MTPVYSYAPGQPWGAVQVDAGLRLCAEDLDAGYERGLHALRTQRIGLGGHRYRIWAIVVIGCGLSVVGHAMADGKMSLCERMRRED